MKSQNHDLHDHWDQILADWEQSEKSGAAFCRDRQIEYWKFNYWKRRLRRPDSGSQENFVAVEFQTETADAGDELILDIGNGLRFILKRGFDETLLRQALGVLRRLGC